ncbi:transcription initiation factor TFIID subunit 7-like [Lytechinus variegatus]|uniref:transcription initiation factor TFIID subunit 7-like n=1 Tax=Lytechinus variegatus TaxID=7654 RepID=UPI001BB19495|nr:transcription initiation factor TFIID subunit 7-like [Lytechinus variegatus]XP_041458321.1 transcription initiation factor TFIID subunit 7-like [Lytechinus variegatus]
MTTTAPKRTQEPLPEVESHLILRVPQHCAEDLKRLVQSGSQMLKDYLKIETHSDMRHALVHIDDDTFAAKVVDLPCMIESHKTLDKKTFWKTADISQMLVCNVEDAPILPDEEAKQGLTKKPEKVDKKFIWKHGVTPPLKNVRKRRFRKTAKKKYIEAPDVEEEVKRLLRMDSTAIKIKWEVLAEEDIKDDKNDDSMGSPPHGDIIHDMFGGDVSDTDDEMEDDEEDMDVNIEDLEDGIGVSPRVLMEGEDSRTAFSDAGMAGDDEEDNDGEDDEDSDGGQEENELAKRLVELEGELLEQESRKKTLEESVASLDNPMLKQRFQSQLDELLADMKKKQEEVETLQSIVGNR